MISDMLKRTGLLAGACGFAIAASIVPISVSTAHAGGASSAQSTQGTANTNGLNAADRDFGRDRAGDRGNAQATTHVAPSLRHRHKHHRIAGSSGNGPNLSVTHISTRGQANTNDANAADRDLGTDRVEDRMNGNGTSHSATPAPPHS